MEELGRLNLMLSLGYLAILVLCALGVGLLFLDEKRDCKLRERRYRAVLEKGPSQGKRDLAYQMLNGDLHLADARLAALRPQLDALVDEIYRHRVELCGRTGLDFEDADLEGIVSAYERLNRLCADGMYDQGWHAAAYEWSLVRGTQSKKSKTRKAEPKT